MQDIAGLRNVTSEKGQPVTLPNGEQIEPTKVGYLSISSDLKRETQKAIVLPKLKSASLISLGRLCDDDCDILLNKHKMEVTKNGKYVCTGYRNVHDGLWDVPLYTHPNPKTTIRIQCKQPKIHSIYSRLPKHTTDKRQRLTKKPHTTQTPHFLNHLASIAEEYL